MPIATDMPGRARLRRHALAAALAWLATLSAAAAAADPAPAGLAPDIFVLPGRLAAPAPNNLGRVANVGVIVGPKGVVVVGTGTSDADGERLLAAIGRLSKHPVVLAIDTYAGPEHVLGNTAFARRGIPILAHRATDDYMAVNCELCQRNLESAVGAAALKGTQPVRPGFLIDGATSIDIGGRRLEILYYGPTQQPGSIAVFDAASGVLFAGGLASFDVLPDAHDADLGNWIGALQQMRRLPLRLVVPARGPVGPPGRLDEVADYLAQLARETQRAYGAGLSLGRATATVDLPAYRRWAAYAQTHPRNVHFQYLRLEARELAGQSAVSQ